MIVVGLVLLLVVVNNFKKRQATPRAVNHQGKLLKEILKALPLKKARDQTPQDDGRRTKLRLSPDDDPLPLGAGQGAINSKGKADKRVVMGVARKDGGS